MSNQELMSRMDVSPGKYGDAIREGIDKLEKIRFSERLWRKDPSLWKDAPDHQKIISNSLGWVDLPRKMESNLRSMTDFTSELLQSGYRAVVHMGMGGSSLAPLAFQQILGTGKDGLPLIVLDTTDPATILDLQRKVPVSHTLFIEASKSGSTAESRAFGEYFYSLVREIKGEAAGENLAVITDPGSMLAKLAENRRYRRIFLNYPDIGGRYSALSYFGLVPAGLMGINLPQLLAKARRMYDACSPGIPVRDNPGALVGAIMGTLAAKGCNKVTFFAPAFLSAFAMWIEQLIAESTGKEGKGILPVIGETPASPDVYGMDRLFVYLRPDEDPHQEFDLAVDRLIRAGHPAITIRIGSRADMIQEFYRWEVATAAAGAILEVNPFDQPNVQETKDHTNRFLQQVRDGGVLPEDKPALVDPPIELYGELTGPTSYEALSSFFGDRPQVRAYVAFLAYLREDAAVAGALESLRILLRNRFHIATTLSYGPRYLHSTGQLHKGGIENGLFVVFTADDRVDLPIPGQPYTFGTLNRAQALGDFAALQNHGRRVIRIHLGKDPIYGLEEVRKSFE